MEECTPRRSAATTSQRSRILADKSEMQDATKTLGRDRSTGAARVLVAPLLVAATMGCDQAGRPDLVGRFVEIRNDTDQQLCPATATYMDEHLQEVLLVLDAPAPSGRFVDYTWGDGNHFAEGVASLQSGRVSIEADSAVHEHELVHAAHLRTWPKAPRFLYEGLAEVLGNTVVFQDGGTWRPVGAELDDALSRFDQSGVYELSWIVVSQIVLEHGFAGLRQLWFELEADSSMQDVRDAYSRLFGRDFDQLTQPFEVTVDGEAASAERGVCWVSLCTGATLQWRDGVARGQGVTGCDGPNAVSPSSSAGLSHPWTTYVVEGPSPVVGDSTDAALHVEVEACGVLRCDHYTVRDAGLADPATEGWERSDAYRVRVETTRESAGGGSGPIFELQARW